MKGLPRVKILPSIKCSRDEINFHIPPKRIDILYISSLLQLHVIASEPMTFTFFVKWWANWVEKYHGRSSCGK